MKNKRLGDFLRRLSALMLAVGLSSWAFAVAEAGFWQPSTGTGSCPLTQVCADWFEGGFFGVSCCIPEEKLGTSDPDACTGAVPEPAGDQDPVPVRDRDS